MAYDSAEAQYEGGSKAVENPERKHVTEYTAELEEVALKLEKSFEDFLSMIGSVLKPTDPTAVGEGVPPSPRQAPLADHLATVRGCLYDLLDRLESAKNRVDV